MNLQFIIIVLFIVGACFASRASRRHRRSQRRNLQKKNTQEANVERILGTQELSLFDNDYPDSFTHYKSRICEYMEEQLFPDKFDRLTAYTFSYEDRSAFANEYISKIYNKENFPLTYRSSDVNLDLTDEEIVKYYSKYCTWSPATSSNFIVLFICFYFACFIISFFVTACFRSGYRFII